MLISHFDFWLWEYKLEISLKYYRYGMFSVVLAYISFALLS